MINIITPQSLSTDVQVTITYDTYNIYDPFHFPGYAGRLARFHAAKHTLDMQVWEWGNGVIGMSLLFCIIIVG